MKLFVHHKPTPCVRRFTQLTPVDKHSYESGITHNSGSHTALSAMIRTIDPKEPTALLARQHLSNSLESVSSKSWLSHVHGVNVTTPVNGGERGATGLSMAVRSRAPRHAIEQLLRANFDLIGVIPPTGGTVLHDAFKCRVEDGALDVLVRAAVHHDQQRSSRGHQASPLLDRTDEFGRTALHYMIGRMVRSLERGDPTSYICWNLMTRMVECCPSTVGTIDADGNTPLVLLLLVSRFEGDEGRARQCEDEIFHLVRFMVERCPGAVKVARRLPRPWHYYFQFERCEDTHDRRQAHTLFVHGDGTPSPLSCAIAQHRSLDTLKVLLEANRQLDAGACTAVVTHHREVPLHIAVSMRASVDILQQLIGEEPRTVSVPDNHGLLPLDWVWIRYTLDMCSWPIRCFSNVAPSRRRYITSNFLEWHERVSNQHLGISKSYQDSSFLEGNCPLTLDLLKRISHLLPIMAGHSQAKDSSILIDRDDGSAFALLLHAACAVNCPLALVALACEAHPNQLGSKDEQRKRLPLHYASSRSGYTAQFPIGVTNQLQGMEEVSPVDYVLGKQPLACRVVDGLNQLPLHIAIDHAKGEGRRRRRRLPYSLDACASSTPLPERTGHRSSHRPVDAILSHYPEALQRRDGRTKLFPFQQAAEGRDGDAELCFLLLRRDPTLITSTSKTLSSQPRSFTMCAPRSLVLS
jgi:hypothetical protein